MDQLRRYAIFAAVVEAGTMTGAAKALGMTPSAVSQHIGQLESLLGLTLLYRSTRRLSLTEAGEVVWQGCQSLQQTLNQTELRLSEVRDSLLGEVRITAPVGMAGQPLALALSPLLQAHPGLCIQIIADDEKRDLIAERIDVALRVGSLPDSTLVARKLGQTRMLLCAAPAYLARKGTPRTPADLATHDWLSGDMLGSGLLLLDERGGEHRVRFKPRVLCNNVLPLRQFTLAGQGISLQPEGEVGEDLAQGRLLALLPGFRVPPMEIHAITPQREIPEKVRRVITALRSHFAEPGGAARPL
ncbi:LysR family transcriptional regulator [Aeromonas media]|uniref:LysR family transcriptional regulator n=1 Tax=Aeromonas media TaxID=651 RepID=UPI001118A2D0|nr:LysR family transcriptional regulator [Aeromonas media]TNI66546.1 LysR family transcriptional regulator [Aeromonas media]